MIEELHEAARNLLQSIDVQLGHIIVGSFYQDDETIALTQQKEELREWKCQILADPTSVIPNKGVKREATDDEPLVNSDENIETAPAVKRTKRVRMRKCSTCFDTFPRSETVKLHCCSTRYCRTCFAQWFITALASKQLPQCCNVGIEPKEYSRHLDSGTRKKYRAVFAELDTERKLFCSNSACKIFIIKIKEDSRGFIGCPQCGHKTCASCSQSVAAHKGRDIACASYLVDKTLNDAIKANGWKRCPRCHIPVEKTAGCKNIRCGCGVLFCFRCGISKSSEGAPCKCSTPSIRVNEIVEDPTGDNWQAPPINSDDPLMDRGSVCQEGSGGSLRGNR